MGSWSRFTREDRAHALYALLVAQARQPAFYRIAGVPDTRDGRFDLIVLHVFLVHERLSALADPWPARAQEIFDAFIVDMDRSLREIGVGDLGVPKRMRAMAEAYFGRARAYASALATGDETGLAAILQKNIHGPAAGSPRDAPAHLAGYVMRTRQTLADQSAETIWSGNVAFPAP